MSDCCWEIYFVKFIYLDKNYEKLYRFTVRINNLLNIFQILLAFLFRIWILQNF